MQDAAYAQRLHQTPDEESQSRSASTTGPVRREPDFADDILLMDALVGVICVNARRTFLTPSC